MPRGVPSSGRVAEGQRAGGHLVHEHAEREHVAALVLGRFAAPPDDRVPFTYDPPEVSELDLAKEGISTVLWTTGYGFDYGWIGFPVFDPLGFPRQARGVTEVSGLYFIGSLWLHNQASATLVGVGLDAQALAERWA